MNSSDNLIGLAETSKGIPGRLRLGDLDADGFPEIILTEQFNVSGQILNSTTLYSNVACLNNEICTPQHDKRFFTNVVSNEYKRLTELAGNTTVMGIFVDIDEDGRIDMLLQNQEETSRNSEILSVYNNIVKDTFFVKALMINSQNVYGDTVFGATYRFVVTDLNDQKFVVVGSQLYQTAYSALLMPYVYLGVGRSNNYVESFNAAFSINGERSIRVWTPIIPNSQLIIIAQEADVSNWQLELFINPTSSLFLIVVACAICLVIIGLVIILLHMGEKKEDEKQRQTLFTLF